MPSCLQSPGGKGQELWFPAKPHPKAGTAEDPRATEGTFLCVVLARAAHQAQPNVGNFDHSFTLSPGEQEKAPAANDTLPPSGEGKKKKEKQAKQHFDPLPPPPCPCIAPCKALGEVERSEKHWQEFDSSRLEGSGGTVGAGK